MRVRTRCPLRMNRAISVKDLAAGSFDSPMVAQDKRSATAVKYSRDLRAVAANFYVRLCILDPNIAAAITFNCGLTRYGFDVNFT